MNNNNGAISFEALLDTSDFSRGTRTIGQQLRDLSREAGVEMNRFDGMFRKTATAVGAYFTFDAARTLISDIVKVRGEFQQLEIAFNTMLGSKAKADALMAQAVDFAANTPFGLEATANATKQLLAYGESADTVFDTLRKLGDIASGLSIPLSDIAYLYGTTMTQGRLYTQDLNQFVGRGIPLIRELASIFGVAQSEVKGMVEAGKVGFPEVQKALDNLTKEGSMFGGLMEAQSKSIPGQIEQLKDAWSQMLNEIGTNSEGMIASSISGLASLVQNYEQVGRILAALAITYGTYRAALMLTAAAQALVSSSAVASTYLTMATSLGPLTFAHRARAVALGVEAAAQRTLNSAMLANPYAAVAAAVVGLVAVMWALHDGTTAEEKAQKKLNDAQAESKKFYDETKASITGYINIIQSETASMLEKIKAYESLKQQAPAITNAYSLIELAALKSSEAQKLAADEAASADYSQWEKKLQSAKAELESLQKQLDTFTPGSNIKSDGLHQYDELLRRLEQQKLEVEGINAKLVEERRLQEEAARAAKAKAEGPVAEIAYQKELLSKLYEQKGQLEANLLLARATGQAFSQWQTAFETFSLRQVENEINRVNGALSSLTAGATAQSSSLSDLKKQKAQNEKDYAVLGEAEARAQKSAYQQKSNDLQREIDRRELKPLEKAKKKKPEEKYLEGSIAYYDKEIQKLQEKLKRLPVTEPNIDTIKEYQDQILILTQSRKDAEKAIAIRTEDEVFEGKRKRYEAYEKLLNSGDATTGANAKDVMMQEGLKKSFEDLRKEGENWLQFLENQLVPLQNKLINGDASEADIFKLEKIKSEISTLKGESTPLENYKKLLEGITNEALSTGAAIKRLQEERAALDAQPESERSALWNEKSNLLNEGIEKATKEAAANLRDYLAQVEGTKQKEADIIKKYNSLIEQAEKEKLETKGLQQGYNDEIAQNYAEGLEAYKSMNELMGAEDIKRLKLQEEYIKEVIQNLVDEGFSTSEIIKKVTKLQQDNLSKQADISYQNMMLWSQAIGSAGQELSQLEGALGNIGQLFAAAAQSAQQFSATYANLNDGNKKNDNQAYASAAQAGVNLIALVIGAAQRRKAKRKQEEANTLQVQLDLNKALVEEIRLRTELSENVYITDYYGRITDSMNAMQEAGFKAFEAIQKLNEVGKAKNGTKNKIDWGAVGAGAGAGATIGAAAGTPVFGVGAAIGAVVGGIVGGLVGLFGALKKDSRYSGLFEIYPELISQAGEFNATLAQTLIANDQLDDKTKQYLQSLIDMNEEWKAARQQITDIVEELSGQMGNQLKDALVGAFEDGTNAATAFAGVVEDTLQNALESLIYSKVFSNLFDTLGTDLENALMFYGATGDLAGVYDAFGKFMDESQGAVDIFNEVMKAAKDYGKDFGFDLWGNEADKRANGLTGQIQGVTEETASLIAGQMNAMRITTAAIDARMADQTIILNNQLFHLANISSNSNYLQKLDRMDRNIDRLVNNNSARDIGNI